MRSLAHIEKIVDIRPIPNADKIEVATVLGWKVVIKKGEFSVGDKIIYIEIDSKVPADNPYFDFLADRKYKVKSIKLRKQVSQGLIVPISLLSGDYKIGDDVTEALGIKKIEEDYKPPKVDKELQLKQHHKKLSKQKWFRHMMKYQWFRKLAFKLLIPRRRSKGWPSWVTKTDEERVQNMPWILQDKDPFICTEKIDGTSATYTLKKSKISVTGEEPAASSVDTFLQKFRKQKYSFNVCSRNVVQTSPDKKCYYEELGNVYWEIEGRYHIEKVLKSMMAENMASDHITLQGEIYGEGIQKNKYEIKGRDFAAFNLIFDGERVDSVTAKAILDQYGIPFVPILKTDYVLPDSIDELMEFSTGESKLNKTLREGIVFRNYDKSISFKCVSNKFLLKWGL